MRKRRCRITLWGFRPDQRRNGGGQYPFERSIFSGLGLPQEVVRGLHWRWASRVLPPVREVAVL